MTSHFNSPPPRVFWLRAAPRLLGIKNGDYLTIDRLMTAFDLSPGLTLRDVLAAGEREGLLIIDRGAIPTTYRATFILERQLTAFTDH